jgi:hypothetical protein
MLIGAGEHPAAFAVKSLEPWTPDFAGKPMPDPNLTDVITASGNVGIAGRNQRPIQTIAGPEFILWPRGFRTSARLTESVRKTQRTLCTSVPQFYSSLNFRNRLNAC